uniref:F-box family protein n=1 Tax=Pithovirus LCPAC401 TaxID=2506595 RepID=A0A481ZAE6_9VIRU|nr:MAG: F-box family protein [Pithovirus LCPAC401]
MTSVSEILSRLNLSRRDLNDVSLVQLETVFKDLTVKEISLLCAVNRRFNTVCENESFWRNKVSDDYGIHKKYGSTWRQTAINMDKVDMINMDGVWIDERTYREILDDVLQNGLSSIVDLQIQYLLPYADNRKHLALILLTDYDRDDVRLQHFAGDIMGRDYTENELDDIFYIKSRETNVIYASVLTYKGKKKEIYLPGSRNSYASTGTALLSYEFIRDMIDPIFYVMQSSSFSDEKLYYIFHYYESDI